MPKSDNLVTVIGGTPVVLTLTETVNSERAVVGQRVELFVRSDVVVDNQVVVRSGSIAEGWVKSVVRTCVGHCAESAKLVIVVESLQSVDGQQVFVRSIPHIITGNNYYNQPAVAKAGTILKARILNNTTVVTK